MCIIGLSVMAQLVGSRHLLIRPAPCGQADPQPPTRCEDRHPPEKGVAAQKKTGSRGEDNADAKTHCELERQTRQDVKLKAHAHRHNDPQLHRPQQQVSILDGLVGEEVSMSVRRRRPLATREKARIGPDVSFSISQDSSFCM